MIFGDYIRHPLLLAWVKVFLTLAYVAVLIGGGVLDLRFQSVRVKP